MSVDMNIQEIFVLVLPNIIHKFYILSILFVIWWVLTN